MADMLATKEELASLLGATVEDGQATLAIALATAVVQGIVGQRLLQVTETVTLMAPYGEWLELPQRPVTAVSSVEINDQAVTGWALYEQRRLWRELGWVLAVDGAPLWRPATVEVSYTHGWPADHQRLQLAKSVCLTLAGQQYSNPTGVVGFRIDDYSEQYAQSVAGGMQVPDSVQSLLKRAYGTVVGSIGLKR